MADKNKHRDSSSTSPEKYSQASSGDKRADVILPLSKVKQIMKSSPEVEQLGGDTVYVIAKVTELFVEHLTKKAFERSKSKSLDYKQLAEYVQHDNNLEFLKDIVPLKVTAKAALLEMAKQNSINNKEILE